MEILNSDDDSDCKGDGEEDTSSSPTYSTVDVQICITELKMFSVQQGEMDMLNQLTGLEDKVNLIAMPSRPSQKKICVFFSL